MRTTITLDDALLQAAKRRALERRTTLGRLIEQALRAFLLGGEKGEKQAPAFRLVTFRGDGPHEGINLDKTSTLLEREDLETFARPRK